MYLFLRRLIRLSLPLIILVGGIIVFQMLTRSAPQAERRSMPVPPVEVEVVKLMPADYTVMLRSQGTVSARTSGTLIPEVGGRIVSVSPDFREGGFFSEGDVLIEIDDSNYRTAVSLAEANLAEAEVRLAEEQARAIQARIDWERLGGGEVPSDLVLREPQLALARASVAAAQARLEEANRDLERTRIVAPYEGRVLRQFADIGQVVGTNSVVAEIYATDYAEIRLPLTNRQYSFLNIPAMVRGEDREHLSIPVTLFASFGSERYSWEGKIVRVEGTIDTSSRQIFVVAQVDDPNGPIHAEPLKVGLFVDAEIQGRTIDQVYTLPRTALREGRFVVTVDESNQVQRVPIDTIWATEDLVVFDEPAITPGTLASVTPLAFAVDGMAVRPVGKDVAEPHAEIAKKPKDGKL